MIRLGDNVITRDSHIHGINLSDKTEVDVWGKIWNNVGGSVWNDIVYTITNSLGAHMETTQSLT
jgi:hypothetical protein